MLRELLEFVQEVHMDLDKWSTNTMELFNSEKDNMISFKSFNFEQKVSALGMHWNPGVDEYCFTSSLDVRLNGLYML